MSLADHADYDEAWLERLIKDEPMLLGLGAIEVVASQIHQAKGRLDLLLKDEKNEVLYVVELMLGGLDETHIVRTIEYWLKEQERKQHEGYELVAVLAAEKVLESRFVDVARFLSRQMPLLLLEILALRVEDKLTLNFLRVFDGRRGETEEVAASADASRESWVEYASEETVSLAENFAEVLQEIDPSIGLTFKQNFLGLRTGNRPTNFMTFSPKRQFVRVWARTERAVEFAKALRDVGFEVLDSSDAEWVGFRVTGTQFERQRPLLKQLAEACYRQRQAF